MKNKSEQSPIKAGTLLLTEKPFTFVLSSKEKGQRCDFCLLKGKVLKCSGCQFVHYCGRVCQKDAWNEHKWECNNLKKISPKVIPDAARMMSKIISRLNRGDGNSFRSFYSDKSFRMWKDLMSHYSDLKTDKKRMDHFTTLCMVLYEFMKDTSIPNAVELMGIYGRMCINSFTILDTDMNSIGTGIYLAASIVDHNCEPNAVATFHSNNIYIRNTKDLDVLDWQQIRISYIDLMKTAFERQSELLESYYFLCQCVRCLDESQLHLMHGAKCQNSQCDNPVQIPWKKNCQLVIKASNDKPSENGNTKSDTENKNGSQIENDVDNHIGGETVENGFQSSQNGVQSFQNGDADEDTIHCNKCGTKVNDKQVEIFKKAMEFTELHLQNMKDAATAYVDVCKYCLDQQDGVLHELNVVRAQTLDHAFDALIQVQLWDQACGYAEKLIPCFRNYYGETHPLLGLLHLKYGKILSYQLKLQESLQQLKLAEKILKITHGDKHPLYREELLPLLRQISVEVS